MVQSFYLYHDLTLLQFSLSVYMLLQDYSNLSGGFKCQCVYVCVYLCVCMCEGGGCQGSFPDRQLQQPN